jgi:prepilin-type processing-associated H-X9-DG protein
MTQTCKHCGAPIRWVRTAKHYKWMPLDPDPDQRGNVLLVDGHAHVIDGEGLAWSRHHAEALYRAHFASCPGREEHK